MALRLLDSSGRMVWSEDQPNSSKKTKVLAILMCDEEDAVAEKVIDELEEEWDQLEAGHSICYETGHVLKIKITER